jgi:hypothetical protein
MRYKPALSEVERVAFQFLSGLLRSQPSDGIGPMKRLLVSLLVCPFFANVHLISPKTHALPTELSFDEIHIFPDFVLP